MLLTCQAPASDAATTLLTYPRLWLLLPWLLSLLVKPALLLTLRAWHSLHQANFRGYTDASY